MAHFAIRDLMHEAALKADEDPDRLSFVHSVHVVLRRMPRYGAIPPLSRRKPSTKRYSKILEERVASSTNRINPRGVKRKMSNYNLRPHQRQRTRRRDVAKLIWIVK